MHTADHIVRLDAFEGPMDLLLHLIKREEVDIQDIPIARVADQYIERLKAIERVDIELAGEFLVMAATLIEIKSRMISPAPTPGDEGATGDEPAGERIDPRAELVEQLLAYKRVRDAAHALEERKTTWEMRFPSGPAPAGARPTEATEAEGDDAPDDAPVDLEDLELFDLVRAFARILETVDLERAARGSHEVQYDDTPIELHAEDVLDRLGRAGEGGGAGPMTLRGLLEGRTRSEMIGLFLAVLELTRRRRVSIESTPDRHDVRLVLNADPDSLPESLPGSAASSPVAREGGR